MRRAKSFPISFGQYTGQEKEETRQKMRERPPQILLTNYMMLELLLTRIRERSIRDAIYENLRFMVFDELHTYRGRQGADVAMLMRRIRARCAHEVVCIGTSATMVSVGSVAEQRAQVAKVATTLFGRRFAPEQVVNETLTRSLVIFGRLSRAGQLSRPRFRPASIPMTTLQRLKVHPVAVWLENQVALEKRDGDLVRRKPSTYQRDRFSACSRGLAPLKTSAGNSSRTCFNGSARQTSACRTAVSATRFCLSSCTSSFRKRVRSTRRWIKTRTASSRWNPGSSSRTKSRRSRSSRTSSAEPAAMPSSAFLAWAITSSRASSGRVRTTRRRQQTAI